MENPQETCGKKIKEPKKKKKLRMVAENTEMLFLTGERSTLRSQTGHSSQPSSSSSVKV